MADEVTIHVDANDGDVEVEGETTQEETPTWLPAILEMASASRELLTEVRAQQAASQETNQMMRSLTETLIQTNANLTAQLAAQSTPPVSPVVVVENPPPTDTPQPDGGEIAPLEVAAAEENAPPPAPRPKRRYL